MEFGLCMLLTSFTMEILARQELGQWEIKWHNIKPLRLCTLFLLLFIYILSMFVCRACVVVSGDWVCMCVCVWMRLVLVKMLHPHEPVETESANRMCIFHVILCSPHKSHFCVLCELYRGDDYDGGSCVHCSTYSKPSFCSHIKPTSDYTHQSESLLSSTFCACTLLLMALFVLYI